MNSGSDGKLHESLTKLRHSPDVVVAIIRLKSTRPTEKAGSRRGDRRKVHEAYLIELDERTRRTKTDFLPKLAALRSLQVLTCFADNYLVVEATVNDLIAAAEFEFVEHILPDFEFVESTIEDPATNGLRASELSALNVPVFQHLRAIVQNYPWTALAEAHKEFEGAFRGMGVEQVVAHLTAAARVKPEADEFDHALGLAVRAVFQPAVKDAVLADIKHTLREAGAQSAGMYVRDPWSSGEFRPYILHGYTYPEPLQAFSDETRSRTALGLNDARDELYFSNAERAVPTDPGYIRWITAEDLPFADELRAELIAARRIFGTLPQREGIRSCARFVGRGSDGGVAFVLWFNFPQAIDFDRDDEVKGVLQVGVARVAGRCRNGEIDRELPPVFPLGGMRQLDRACESLQLAAYLALSYRGSDAPPSDLSVEACLSPLLEEMLRAVHLPAGNATYRLQQVGSAAIYLLEAGTGFLTIVSAVGPLKPTKPVRQALAKGEGLVSWAALRGQPLLVNDIEHSQFHAIYQMLHPDVRHEMAVPMIVGNRIIGVLNLESGGPPFPPESVPVIMAVAAKAARACLLYEQRKAKDHEARRRNRVGELTGLMPRRPISRSTKKTWNKWSEFVCEELEGSFCAVWGRDDPPEPDAPFRKLGEYFSQEIEKPDRKKLAGIEDTPRATHGWTDFVLRTHAPVCLTSDQQKQFRPLYWRDIGGQPHWHLQPPPDAADIPNQQHPSLLQRGIKCALAIPLKSKDECFAVAWIKYLSGPVRALPASNVNDWLLAFAATMIYNLHNTKSGQVYSIQAIAPSHRSMEDLVHFPGVDLVSGV